MASYRRFSSFGGPTFYTPWAQHMYQALEGLGPAYSRRLHSLRREGGDQRVISLEVAPGRILARTADRWSDVHHVRIVTRTMPDEVWQRVADALGQDTGKLTALLASVPSVELQRLFTEAGGWLFPSEASDLEVICTCNRQWEGLCAHAAASLLTFCSCLESQPGLLLTLWGWPVERLVAQVHGHWKDLAGQADREAHDGEQAGLPSTVRAAAFFRAAHPLPDQEPAIAPAQIETALLRRMGRPPFAEEAEDVEAALAPLYRYVTKRAVQVWDRTAQATTQHRRTRGRRRR